MSTTVSFCKVRDLKPRDRVPPDTVLGGVSSNEVLTVKSVQKADHDKFALTFHGVGTFFVHGDTMVQLVEGKSYESTDQDNS